jgi:hypothetical protein
MISRARSITEIISLRDIRPLLSRELVDGRLEASNGADSEENKDDSKGTRLMGGLEWLDPESLLG